MHRPVRHRPLRHRPLGYRLLMLSLLFMAGSSVWPLAAAERTTTKSAVFAGGCFWSVETDFDKASGVVATTSGFAGGQEKNPSYEQVSSGLTSHLEAVRVEYDPARTSYTKLVEYFWRHIDPVNDRGQFCDEGAHYRTAIFVATNEEKATALKSKAALQASGKLKGKIATRILAAGNFYPAEDYHQNFAEKNPLRYKAYRRGCGRDARLKEVWGAPR